MWGWEIVIEMEVVQGKPAGYSDTNVSRLGMKHTLLLHGQEPSQYRSMGLAHGTVCCGPFFSSHV